MRAANKEKRIVINKNNEAEIIKDYEEKMLLKVMKTKHNIKNTNTIYRILKKHNVKMRNKPKKKICPIERLKSYLIYPLV